MDEYRRRQITIAILVCLGIHAAFWGLFYIVMILMMSEGQGL
jgi:hypothetical protein